MVDLIAPRAQVRLALAAIRLRLGLLDLRCRLAQAHVRQFFYNAVGITSAAALLLPLSPVIGAYLIARRYPRACGHALTVGIGYIGIYYSGAAEVSDHVLTGWPRFVVHTALPLALLLWAAVAADMLKGLEKEREGSPSRVSGLA